MKKPLFNDDKPKNHSFSIKLAVRDSLGNPTGKYKEFSTDSAYKLSQFWLRENPPKPKRTKASELPKGEEAQQILNNLYNNEETK